MNKIFTIILTLISVSVFGKKNPTADAQLIVAEGKLLYRSEMASWYGTDLFLEKYKDLENIGGYFSYIENDTAKCIFFSKGEDPKVIGTISFDSTYNIRTAPADLTERNFTNNEYDLYQIRKAALQELLTNTDGLFKFYENTYPNIIPLIKGQEKKAYILTGPHQSGVVIFGNDYLLTFDKNNKLKTKRRLHNNIIPIEYGNPEDGKEADITMHSHLPETGDFITATDICTLMLYQKFTQWKMHNVASAKYLNIWSCEAEQLNIIPMSFFDNIEKDQEKRNKQKHKSH